MSNDTTRDEQHPSRRGGGTVATAVDDRGEAFAAEHAEAIDWLESQFPDWTIEVAATTTWADELRPIWIAHKDGHHPQSELSAAKLHTRLTEYLEREDRRDAMMN